MARPSKKTPKRSLKQIAFTRFMLVIAFLVLWIGGISVRLVHLQVTQHASLKQKAESNRQDVRQSRMLRGTILDRNGRTLAMSLRVKTLYADPREIGDLDKVAKAVGKALKMDAGQLAQQFKQAKESNKRFVPIAKKLEEDAVQRINKALDDPDVKKADLPNTTGLHWREDQKRSYPNQSLAAQVIGYSDSSDSGQAGIEQSQDELLRGKVVNKRQERDRLGRVYEETIEERDAPSDIVLTIDTGLQYMTDQALERGVKAADAKSGIAIAISPKTGEILALSNYPTFDPNVINEKAEPNIANRAIQFRYAPGSVFKIVTYGSALERKMITPTAMVSSGSGTIEVAKHKFTDSHAVGTVSYSQAMAHSSNVCAIKTAMSVGREDFYGLTKKFGFGERTGIELPAETAGVVRHPDKWYGDSLASMSIGYEIGVTALQMASAFATVANNGIRIAPHIIKEVRRSDDQPKTVTQAQQTQVLSQETARHLRTMLQQVVLTGTGRRAKLNGYTAAGKTGTAWKFNEKTKTIDSGKYISSFIGMAPADDPEVVIAVMMDEPKAGSRDGGGASAPVFREIAQQLLQEMRVMPDAPIKNEQFMAQQEIPETPVTSQKELKSGGDETPAVGAKPKIATRGVDAKEKQKDSKKATERKTVDAGKLTAVRVKRPGNARPQFDSAEARRIKFYDSRKREMFEECKFET